MNMTVIRYINNEPYRGEKLPAIEVENLGVVMVLKDLIRQSQNPVTGRMGNSPIDFLPGNMVY